MEIEKNALKKRSFIDLYSKTRRMIGKFVESAYVQGCIIFFAIFSLFNDYIRLLCIPQNADYAFWIITKLSFVIFSLEFLLSCLFLKKYLWSLNFLTDFVSVLSMINNISPGVLDGAYLDKFGNISQISGK
jgi:hypothetical protein